MNSFRLFQPLPSKFGTILIHNTRFQHIFIVHDQSDVFHVDWKLRILFLFKNVALDATHASVKLWINFHISVMMKHGSAWTGPDWLRWHVALQRCKKNALIIECFINLTSPLATLRERFQNPSSPAWSIAWQKPALGRLSKAAVSCQGWFRGKSLSHAVPCECSGFTKTNSPAHR